MNKNDLPAFEQLEDRLSEFSASLKEAVLKLKQVVSLLHPPPDSVKQWDQLISQWIEDKRLPLYVRKFGDLMPRGEPVEHLSGRILIPSDNGPAHWAFSMCFNGNLISLEDVTRAIETDQIPIAFALKAKEKNSKYKFTRHEVDTPNRKGWKIAHRDPIGLNTRQPVTSIEIGLLEEHFRRFMSPSNMFLIPLKYAGLAEIEEVIRELTCGEEG